MRRAFLVAGLMLAVNGPGELGAQRTSASPEGPGVVVMRAYACGIANVDSAAMVLADTWGGMALELIREGLLIDYEILKRVWGDEWNLIEMFFATDEDEFRYALEELELRLYVADAGRNRGRTFATLCPRRKDSQYSVVSSPL